MAERLEAGLRSAEVVGRYGGDEFMIVLYPCGASEAEVVTGRLRRLVGLRPIETPAGPIAPTISLGVGVDDGQLAPEKLVEAADQALYRAKHSGRNRFSVATDDPDGLSRGRRSRADS